MKKLFLVCALLFISFSSTFAFQLPSFDKGVKVTKKTSSAGIDLSINLGEIKAADQIDAEMIDKIITSELQNYSALLDCKVTVSAEVNVGVAKFTISVEVSGNCAEVRKEGRNIANQIIDDIKYKLTHPD